jgi:hypothetical protein
LALAACRVEAPELGRADPGDCSEVFTFYDRTLIVYESGFAEYQDGTGLYWAGEDLRQVPDDAIVNAFFHWNYDAQGLD